MTIDIDLLKRLIDFPLAEDAAQRQEATKSAYEEWVAADRLWMAELVKAFGKDACNRRFDGDQSGHPPACREACIRWHNAGDIARKLLGWDKPAITEMF